MNEIETLTISRNPVWAWLNRFEHTAGFAMLMLLAAIPFADALLRTLFHSGVPLGTNITDALIMPITFIGIALTTKEKRHMAIAIDLSKAGPRIGAVLRPLLALLVGVVVGVFFWTSLEYIVTTFKPDDILIFIPMVVFLAFFPFGLFLVLLRSFPRGQGALPKIAYLAGVALSALIGFDSIAVVAAQANIAPMSFWGMDLLDVSWWHGVVDAFKVPLIVLLLASAFVGAPLYVVLGGVAMLLFAGDGVSRVQALVDGYSLVKNGSIPSIALFTLTGYLLSESQACQRLIRLFQGLFGRLPGGIVIVTVLLSAFFTAFTGASGITILALGALLLAILKDSAGNSERFSVGLITSTGAIGLLFPPSLGIIIYGSVEMASLSTSGVMPLNILQLFQAAALPGLLFVLAMIVVGAFMAKRQGASVKAAVPPLPPGELRKAFLDSLPELLLPVVVIGVFFSGVAGIVESAAFAAVYTLIIEVFVKREIGYRKLVEISVRTLIIFGGMLAILCFAKGLSSYMVFTGFDKDLVDWAQNTLRSPWLFLLFMNIVLLIAGSLMEIFTAIVIFVPLLTLVAIPFGISQAHLAVIFLANMSIGFMMPPVGMDLFLASYRFKRPVTKVYRDILPFFLVQLAVLMLITYVPWFSTVLVK